MDFENEGFPQENFEAMADSGKRVRLEAADAKPFCAEAGVRAVGKAVQILGGYSLVREFPIERMYRDLKGIGFGAGTKEE